MCQDHHVSIYHRSFFFFDELTLALSKAVIKLDNLIVKDIAMLVCSGYDKLEEFCDTFNLTNLIKSETHYSNDHKLITRYLS